jgi:hypothetical protein
VARDLTGLRSGKLVVLGIAPSTAAHQSRWDCLCDCGKHHIVHRSNLTTGRITHCGCSKQSTDGENNPNWKGYEGISGEVWNRIRAGANARNKKGRVIALEIDKEYVWELFLAQDGTCALSGVPITLPVTTLASGTASLDRIDSSKGYIEGNVQWVHKDVNKMKNALDQDYFVSMCEKIASHKRSVDT